MTDNLPMNVNNDASMFPGASSEDLIAGGTASFPTLSIRAGKFRAKPAGGEEDLLRDGESKMPVQYLDVVFIDAQQGISKAYYTKQYADGDAEAPDCHSVNGETPDPDVPDPISPSCKSCPYNQFGSSTNPASPNSKECGDGLKVATTFAGDIQNEVFGGPMLLRIPGGNLKDLRAFSNIMKAKGYMHQQLAIRLSFDPETSYPKLVFQALRPLNDSEKKQVAALYRTQIVSDILGGQQHCPADQITDRVEAAPVGKPAAPAPASTTEFLEPAAAAPKDAAPAESKDHDGLDSVMGDLDKLDIDI